MLRAGGSASACSSARVYTYGGSATAWSRANAAVINAAAASCASAAGDAYASWSMCGGVEWSSAQVVAAAESCAAAIAKVVVKAAATSYTSGASGACASSCSSGNALALAVAYAASHAIAEASANCPAVVTVVQSQTFAKAFVDVAATATAFACSKSRPGQVPSYSYADASAVIKASANSIAQALGQVWAAACASGCSSYSSCGTCHSSDLPATAIAASYADITNGKYALASNIAEAGAKVCSGADLTTTVYDLTSAWLDLCFSAWYKLYSRAYASKGATACGLATVDGQLLALAQASVDTFAAAWSYNYQGCAESYATLSSSVTLPDNTQVHLFGPSASYGAWKAALLYAYNRACAEGGQSTTGATYVKYFLINNPGYAAAIADAYSTVQNQCGCRGNPWCCSTCQWSASCDGYKADTA